METVFKTHEIFINYNWGDELFIIPFGDIHRDTPSCDVDRWRWFLNCCKKYPQDKTYYLGMGDFNDFASDSKQNILIKNPKLHKQTLDTLDLLVQKHNRKIAKEISFMRGHMLGILDGNHNWVFQNGTTATQDLADRMYAPYLGWLTHLTINLQIHNTDGKKRENQSIRIFIVACHGKAGGKLIGTSINQIDDLKKIFPSADIYIMGHDHQRSAIPTAVLIPSFKGPEIKQKRQFLSRSGSFKKGYCDGMSGYEVGRLLRPSDLGVIVYIISVHRDTKETDRLVVDIKALI